MPTILVVDDEFGVAEVLQLILEDEGYQVVTCANGAELTGHGVFLIDPTTGDLLWWFFDSDGVPPVPLHGRFAGWDRFWGAIPVIGP